MTQPAPPYHEQTARDLCLLVAYHRQMIDTIDAGTPPPDLDGITPADARAFSVIEVREIRSQLHRLEASTTDARNGGSVRVA